MHDEEEVQRAQLRNEFNRFFENAKELYRIDPACVSSFLTFRASTDSVKSKVQK